MNVIETSQGLSNICLLIYSRILLIESVVVQFILICLVIILLLNELVKIELLLFESVESHNKLVENYHLSIEMLIKGIVSGAIYWLHLELFSVLRISSSNNPDKNFTFCFKIKGCKKTQSEYRNEDLELDDCETVDEFAMTSLGKLIFVDAHSRHSKSLSSEESSNLDFTESLSLAFESLFYMPYDIIENYASTINTLDISHNKFSRNLHFLTEFDNLTSLNLDHNNIDAFTIFPHMPKLQLLWLNNNKVDDLFPFVKNLYESVPNLRYLCLMGNKAAPSYLNGGSFYDYLQYRLFVISWFPRLIHLDDRLITSEQRLEATRLFKRPLLEQLTEHTPIPECIKVLHNKLSRIFIKSATTDNMRIPKSSNFVI